MWTIIQAISVIHFFLDIFLIFIRLSEKWGVYATSEDEIASRNSTAENLEIKRATGYFHVPIHHYIANKIYDYPFYLITGLGIPVAGYIFSEQVKLTGYKFSQRVMHSRIFAQASVIGKYTLLHFRNPSIVLLHIFFLRIFTHILLNRNFNIDDVF